MKSTATPYVQNIIFHGNSLFARGNANLEQANSAPIACYNKIILTKKVNCFNFNVSGKRLSNLITDFPTIVQPSLKKGDIVVCNELTNTLNDLQNVTDVYNLLLDYRDLVVAQGCKLVVVTMTARGTGYATIETDRLALNTMILANASEFEKVSDAGGLAVFNSILATANTTYYNADTLHFATTGYTTYGEFIADDILEII